MARVSSAQVLECDRSYIVYGGGLSFITSILIFTIISPRVSRALVPKYANLTLDQRMEWNDRFLSNVNAVISIILSGYTLYFDRNMNDDIIWHDSPGARLACAIIVGYMIADIVCMLVWCSVSRGEMIGFVFHHSATIYAYYYISAYGVLCYFGMLRLIAEMSTPSVNQRWFFDILEYPRSKFIVIFNGLLLLLSFLVFRMLAMPVFWYQIWLITGTPAASKLGHIQLIMYIPTFVLDLLNIFWFYKICRGFAKALFRLRDSTNSDTNANCKSL